MVKVIGKINKSIDKILFLFAEVMLIAVGFSFMKIKPTGHQIIQYERTDPENWKIIQQYDNA